MPDVGVTRELSVGEVSAIHHRHNVIIISLLAVVFMGAFFFSLRDLSPMYAVGVIFLLGFFLISFINIRVGFLLVVIAFLFSPEVNLPFSQYRDFTIRIEDMLIIVLALAWLGRLAMGLQKNFFIYTPLNMPILLIVIWNAICSYVAVSRGIVDINYCIMTNLKYIEFFTVYFLIVNNLNELREVKFMFYVLLITAFVIGIYAATQIPGTQVFTEHRLTAPFEGKPEPNTLGAYLAIFFGIALSIYLFAEPSFMKKLCLALVLLLPFPIMFSFSRSAYYAAIAMAFIVAAVGRRKQLMFLLIIFLLLSPFILPSSVIDRVLYNFRDARLHGFLDQSFGERMYVFKKAWNLMGTYPYFGSGVGAYGGVIDSQYARILIETSYIGFVLFIWLIVRLFGIGARLLAKSGGGWLKGAAVGFIAVMVGVIVHCWGNVTFCIVRIAEPFWALAGLVAYSLYYTTGRQET